MADRDRPSESSERAAQAEEKATFRDVFRPREARYLYAAFVLSLLGDQLARVAISILVYDRTSSPLLTAAAYAVSYVPYIVGGPILTSYADRYPRRRVLITCDLMRAALVGCLALPGIPLAALIGLLFVASLFAPPFEGARAATWPEILKGDAYVVGNAVTVTTKQVAQIFGFLLGGILVAAISARGSLGINAATFLVSAALVVVGIRRRPAPPHDDTPRSVWHETRAGARVVLGNPQLRSIVLLVCTASGFAYAYAGIAAPLADQLNGDASTVGILLACGPVGMSIGGIFLAKLGPTRRRSAILPLAVASPLLLAPTMLTTEPWLIAVLLVASGIATAFNIPLSAAFFLAVPSAYRARAAGVVESGLQTAQGLGVLVAGAVASTLAPNTVVTLVGLTGTVCVAAIVLRWHDTP